jgi:hypothetical protein
MLCCQDLLKPQHKVRERGPFRRVLHQRKAEEVEDRPVVPQLRGLFRGDELLKCKRRHMRVATRCEKRTPSVDPFNIRIASPSSENKPRQGMHLEEKEAFSSEPRVNGMICQPNLAIIGGFERGGSSDVGTFSQEPVASRPSRQLF